MRFVLIAFSLISFPGCTSFGGVLTSETTWFQDWSCERQDGICARTDTIDAITIDELDGPPAEAGPVSGYPAEKLPLSATPKLLHNIKPLDPDYFEGEIERGRPFLETNYAERQIERAPAMLGGDESANSIDAFMTEPAQTETAEPDPFETAFPAAAIAAQFAALEANLVSASAPNAAHMILASATNEIAPNRKSDALNSLALEAVTPIGLDTETNVAAADEATNTVRITRTIVRRDGKDVPAAEQVREIVEPETRAQETSVAVSLNGAEAAEPMLISAVETEPTTNDRQDDAPNRNDAVLAQPKRSAAKVLPVVISAYVDARGVFHERTVVWLEVESADWILE